MQQAMSIYAEVFILDVIKRLQKAKTRMLVDVLGHSFLLFKREEAPYKHKTVRPQDPT